MTGKILGLIVIVSALAAGAALYYFQIYGFYYEVEAQDGQDVVLVPQGSDTSQPVPYRAFQAIDADSSPIRYRACFKIDTPLDDIAAAYTAIDDPEPLTAPGWFDCFDAQSLAADLEAGRARAFLSVKNVHFGVDRIVAVTEDGLGYAWHQLNNCGQKAYDGTVVGEDCPPRPGS